MLPIAYVYFKKSAGDITDIEFSYGGDSGSSRHSPSSRADSKCLDLILKARKEALRMDPAKPEKESEISGDFRNVYNGRIFNLKEYFETGYEGRKSIDFRLKNARNGASLIASFGVPPYGHEYSVEKLALLIGGSHNLLPEKPIPENIENSIEFVKFNIEKWILNVSMKEITRKVSDNDGEIVQNKVWA
ncbi:MAG: hypothetical protein WA139_05120 [Candidatus Aenigmatarchaeota archaeon]